MPDVSPAPPAGELLPSDPEATEAVEDDIEACIEDPLDPTYLERVSKETV
jgi:hypothetical protein